MATFKDVPDGYPNQAEVERIAALGIMVGSANSDGSRSFYPEKPISRREFAIILDRLNIGEALKGYIQQ